MFFRVDCFLGIVGKGCNKHVQGGSIEGIAKARLMWLSGRFLSLFFWLLSVHLLLHQVLEKITDNDCEVTINANILGKSISDYDDTFKVGWMYGAVFNVNLRTWMLVMSSRVGRCLMISTISAVLWPARIVPFLKDPTTRISSVKVKTQ